MVPLLHSCADGASAHLKVLGHGRARLALGEYLRDKVCGGAAASLLLLLLLSGRSRLPLLGIARLAPLQLVVRAIL